MCASLALPVFQDSPENLPPSSARVFYRLPRPELESLPHSYWFVLKPGNPVVRPSATANHFRELVSCVHNISRGCDEARRGSNLGEEGFTLAPGLKVHCPSLCQGELTHIRRDQKDREEPEVGPGYQCQGQFHSDPRPTAKPHIWKVPQIPKSSSGDQTFKRMSWLGYFTSKPNDHREWASERPRPCSLYSLTGAQSRKHWAPEAGSPSCPQLTDAKAWEEPHLHDSPTGSAGKSGLNPGLLDQVAHQRLPAGSSLERRGGGRAGRRG